MTIFTEETKQLIISSGLLNEIEFQFFCHLHSLGYSSDGNVLKKGNSKPVEQEQVYFKFMSQMDIGASITPNEGIPIAKKIVTSWNDVILKIDARATDSAKVWEDTVIQRQEEDFSDADYRIFDGLYINNLCEGKTDTGLVVRKNEGNFELEQLPNDPDKLSQVFFDSTVNVDGKEISRSKIYKAIANHFQRSEPLTLGQNTEIEMLDANKMSSVLLNHFASPSIKAKKDGGYVTRLSIKKKPTMVEYLNKALPYFRDTEGRSLGVIKDLSNDKNTPCLKYIDIEELLATEHNGKFPSIAKILNRLEAKEMIKTVMLWLGALVNDKSSHRQILYMQGQGFDGKGAFIRGVEKFMEGTCATIDQQSASGNMDFFVSTIANKRFISYPDCKNTRLIYTGWVHNVTGGDTMVVNPKHEKQYTTRMTGKMLVASNEKQQLDLSQTNQTSRFLFVKFRKLTVEEMIEEGLGNKDSEGNFQRGLGVDGDSFKLAIEQEMPYFLAHCCKLYAKHMPNHGEICQSAVERQILENDNTDIDTNMLEQNTYIAINHFSEVLKKDKKDSVSLNDFVNKVRDNLEENELDNLARNKYLAPTIRDLLYRSFNAKVSVKKSPKLVDGSGGDLRVYFNKKELEIVKTG